MVESAVFPGLRLSVPAMLAGDRAALLAALHAPTPPADSPSSDGSGGGTA